MLLKCSKCAVDKPLDQYETYWHSVQNKTRMRKYCKTCFKEQKRIYRESIKMNKITQPVSPEPPTIDYSSDPNYYNCIYCDSWKELSDFYLAKNGKPITKRCRDCQNQKDRDKTKERRKENGGSLMIPKTPNVYFDEYQKQHTFEFMKLLGYIYNEENGVWLKPGVKELDENNKIVFLKVRKYKRKHDSLTRTDIQQIRDLYKSGNNFGQVAKLVNRNPSTVWKVLAEYEPTFKKRYEKGN